MWNKFRSRRSFAMWRARRDISLELGTPRFPALNFNKTFLFLSSELQAKGRKEGCGIYDDDGHRSRDLLRLHEG